MTHILSLLIFGVVFYIPAWVHACAVCADPNDEARIAFIFTTGLLTFCPLIVMWLIFSWLRKAALEFEQEEQNTSYVTTHQEEV